MTHGRQRKKPSKAQRRRRRVARAARKPEQFYRESPLLRALRRDRRKAMMPAEYAWVPVRLA